jgi:hypothetical protein
METFHEMQSLQIGTLYGCRQSDPVQLYPYQMLQVAEMWVHEQT